jgi:hypothetical protein
MVEPRFHDNLGSSVRAILIYEDAHRTNRKGLAMNSILNVMITIAVIGLSTTVIAASNNVDGAGAKSGNAQGGQPSEAKHRACRADVKKFCQGIKPGEGRILVCLKANATKLSQECAAQLDKAPTRQAHGQEQEEGNSGGY